MESAVRKLVAFIENHTEVGKELIGLTAAAAAELITEVVIEAEFHTHGDGTKPFQNRYFPMARYAIRRLRDPENAQSAEGVRADMKIGSNGIPYLRINGVPFQPMTTDHDAALREMLPNGSYTIIPVPEPEPEKTAIAYHCRDGWVMCAACKELQSDLGGKVTHCRHCLRRFAHFRKLPTV